MGKNVLSLWYEKGKEIPGGHDRKSPRGVSVTENRRA